MDAIDTALVHLLQERLENAMLLGRIKNSTETDVAREEQVLIQVNALGKILHMDPSQLQKIYALLFAGSKQVQQQAFNLIGFQGNHGAYCEEAALHAFQDGIPICCGSFQEVILLVEAEVIDYGIIPLVNSRLGPFPGVASLLDKASVHIHQEITLPISHCLLSLPGVALEQIQIVYSHRLALVQCQKFITLHGFNTSSEPDTAGSAARIVREQNPAFAAIASRRAASMYGLDVLASNIQDEAGNQTVFGILSK